jgi:PIN domain nuclease of toxin-antitoxin system
VSKIVLDSSAVLAILNGEAGAEKLTPGLLSDATISVVNLAEVQSKLISHGLAPEDAWDAATGPVRESEPFTVEHARITGELVVQTRPLGLSLGDRACLALGIALGAAVYTADQSWKGLRLGIRIHHIR